MARSPDPSRPNVHAVAVGASGSGKTTWVRQEIRRRKASRLLIWDPDEDHDAHHLTSVRAFVRAVKAAHASGKGYRLALTVPASREAFETWAGCAWAVRDPAAPVLAVAEEIADVTTTAKAPQTWGIVVRRGRKWGVDYIATTQRPAEADKTTATQAGAIWCGRLAREQDRRAVAAELDVSASDLGSLKPLEYYQREGAEAAKRGKLKIRGKS